MKKIFLLFALFLSLTSFAQRDKDVYMFSYFTDNGQDGLHLAYSYDGQNWTALNDNKSYLAPVLGKDSLMRDPAITVGADGTFHMVWTTGWRDRHIGYSSSKDLINWTPQKLINVMAHEPEAKNCWAPEMYYDAPTKQYYIFWATTIPGRHSNEEQITVTEGQNNHRMYYVTTKDFKTFSDTKMFFNPDFSVIDISIIKDGEKIVMFLKNENPAPKVEKNIRVTVSTKTPLDFPTEVSAPITGDYWAEGPTPLKVGEYMYVYFDKYREHKYGAVRSKNLTDWEDVSDKINFPAGTRHGAAFKVDESVLKKLLK